MLIFLDTEFTDLRAPELISLGLVAEDGREFYAEFADFRLEACTPFVRREVLPLLGDPTHRRSREAIALDLRCWLVPYAKRPTAVAFDDDRDWLLLIRLLREHLPITFSGRPIGGCICREVLEDWYLQPGVRRHHALDDARGNRHAYRAHGRCRPVELALTA